MLFLSSKVGAYITIPDGVSGSAYPSFFRLSSYVESEVCAGRKSDQKLSYCSSVNCAEPRSAASCSSDIAESCCFIPAAYCSEMTAATCSLNMAFSSSSDILSKYARTVSRSVEPVFSAYAATRVSVMVSRVCVFMYSLTAPAI